MEITRKHVYSVESRSALAKMVTKLFHLWGLPAAAQLELLGLRPRSRYLLTKYRGGKPISDSRDTIDRVGWLMSIHRNLGLLYPFNEDIRYSWVNRRNESFDNLTPLDVMKEQGLIGLYRVAKYLDHYKAS